VKYIVVYIFLAAGVICSPAKAQKPSLSLLGTGGGQYSTQAVIDTCCLGDSISYLLPADSLQDLDLLKPSLEDLLREEPHEKKARLRVLHMGNRRQKETKRARVSVSLIVKSLHPSRMLLITPHKQIRHEY